MLILPESYGEQTHDKPKPLAIFDADGTILHQNLLLKLIDSLCASDKFDVDDYQELEQLSYLYEDERTEGRYDAWIKFAVESFLRNIEGKPRDMLHTHALLVTAEALRLRNFTTEAMRILKQTHVIVIASGSPQLVVDNFSANLPVDHSFGSRLDTEQKDGLTVYTGKGRTIDKVATIDHLVETGIAKLGKLALAFGDTYSDVPMMSHIVDHGGIAVCINPTAALTLEATSRKPQWHRVIESRNSLTQIDQSGMTHSLESAVDILQRIFTIHLGSVAGSE